MSCYDYVVSNADELDAAIANLKSSNNSDSAPRRTVFLKNGAYTYGTLEGTYQHNISLAKVYNVSLIGESKDGVIVSGTTDGITSSTIDLGDGTGNYLQDITIRNNYDFRAEQLKGVSVALTGGNKTIMKQELSYLHKQLQTCPHRRRGTAVHSPQRARRHRLMGCGNVHEAVCGTR